MPVWPVSSHHEVLVDDWSLVSTWLLSPPPILGPFSDLTQVF